MTANPEIVVVGAGSNSLVAAAYLAKAGKSVLVLEKNDQCGGGVVSIEIAPGFTHDPHAAGYYTCMANPALEHDELGLFSEHGLEMLPWEAGFATIFDTGDGLTAYTDVDRACEDIAQYSQKDADTYRNFVNEAQSILPLLNLGSASPPLPTGSFISMLEASALGNRLVDALFLSASDLLDYLFESEEVKIHYNKWCSEMMEAPTKNGTGIVLYNLLGLAHSYKAHIPVGGSKSITNALIRCIEHYGGEVRTNSEVSRLIVKSGDTTGVQLSTGERVDAKDAVLACIHPWRLKEMLPEVDDGVAAAARRVKLSNHGALNQQIALTEYPQFTAGSRWYDALCIEYVRKDLIEVLRTFDHYRYGEIPPHHLSPLTMMNSKKDPSRAPDGQCAMYLYHFAPLVLRDGGLEAWEEHRQVFADAIWDEFKRYAPNMDDSKVIARHIESPLEHHRHSASMVNGDIYGIGTTAGQIMGRRPTKDLADYTVPNIDGLYLVGPFMHPGGTVNFGGRATAIKMYQDLGMDLKSGFEAI
ncbi:MAG: NAD(P)/FAD-dependent oxidoreductase [Halieaceae bacterium]|nr:NAD(P)/FAD-dependent oxidoreductase [Halieaceae bacterium]